MLNFGTLKPPGSAKENCTQDYARRWWDDLDVVGSPGVGGSNASLI